MKRRTITMLAIVMIGLSSCSLPLTKEARLTEEAKAFLRQRVDQVLVKCGDSYYLYQPEWGTLLQFKGLSIQADNYSASEADKANGLEWQGWLTVTCTISRWYGYRDSLYYEWSVWHEWSDCGADEVNYAYATKKMGEWSFNQDYCSGGSIRPGWFWTCPGADIGRIACDELPK